MLKNGVVKWSLFMNFKITNVTIITYIFYFVNTFIFIFVNTFIQSSLLSEAKVGESSQL